jgi:hypothetical protein
MLIAKGSCALAQRVEVLRKLRVIKALIKVAQVPFLRGIQLSDGRQRFNQNEAPLLAVSFMLAIASGQYFC